jgi:phospholipase C
VWARTVLFVNYDENDGFFDHVPPPAPPARGADGALLGASTVDTAGEYHLVRNPTEASAERAELMGRPYGLGPRVPMYVISPWSRGGRVNSQVFDHTSVIRFLEQRFGVAEPNISPWRRAVCGDLVSAFNFKTPNDSVFMTALPETSSAAAKAAALLLHTKPPTPKTPQAPVQAAGVRSSCALHYDLRVDAAPGAAGVKLKFGNDGKAGAVFHVYDRHHLDLAPRRYTVEPGKQLEGVWAAGAYDLWVLGPNGFHRHFVGAGAADEPLVTVTRDPGGASLTLALKNPGAKALQIIATPNAYTKAMAAWSTRVAAGGGASHKWRLKDSGGWYDVSVKIGEDGTWLRRVAGRLETGKESVSDPAMAGQALMQ